MNPADYAQFLFALIFVLGLIGLGAVLLRRYGPGGMIQPRRKPGENRRLMVIETLALDPRRRLLLVRRDGTEHLLLLGPDTDRIVETGITPPLQDIDSDVPGTPASPSVQQRFGDVVRMISRGKTEAPAPTEKATTPQREEQA